MPGPNSWRYERDKDDGTTHHSSSWRDDGDRNIIHRESYDVDSEGNVTGYHYGQKDISDGSHVTYDYHSGEWEDHT